MIDGPHVYSYVSNNPVAMSDPTGKGDYHGDVDAIRRANRLDPHRRIYEGPPAVHPSHNGAPREQVAG